MVFESSAESEQDRAGYRQAEHLQHEAGRHQAEQQQQAGHVHEAAQADAALHAVLRRDYPGRHDVLDALWWRAHPLTESPAGRPDPAAELPSLQAAVYSRARSAESASDDDERLAALQRTLEQDTADLDELLKRYPAPPSSAETGPLPSARVRKVPLSVPLKGSFRTLAGTGADDATEIEGGDGGDDGAESAAPPRLLRGPRGAALLLVAGAAAGVVVLLALQASGLAGATDAVGPAAPTAGVSEAAGPTASASTVLMALDGPEFVPDATTPALAGDYSEVHNLFGPSSTPGIPFQVFAARKSAAQYCLVFRAVDLSGTSVCNSLEEISRTGLHLDATIRAVLDGTSGLAASVAGDQFVDVSVTWQPDGQISASSATRAG